MAFVEYELSLHRTFCALSPIEPATTLHLAPVRSSCAVASPQPPPPAPRPAPPAATPPPRPRSASRGWRKTPPTAPGRSVAPADRRAGRGSRILRSLE